MSNTHATNARPAGPESITPPRGDSRSLVVERTTCYLRVVPLLNGYKADAVRQAITEPRRSDEHGPRTGPDTLMTAVHDWRVASSREGKP